VTASLQRTDGLAPTLQRCDGRAKKKKKKKNAGNARICAGACRHLSSFRGLVNDTLLADWSRHRDRRTGKTLRCQQRFTPAANIDTITDYTPSPRHHRARKTPSSHQAPKTATLKDNSFEIGRHADDHNDYPVYTEDRRAATTRTATATVHGIAIRRSSSDHLQPDRDDSWWSEAAAGRNERFFVSMARRHGFML